jgi:hypothetical protein
VKRVVGRKVWVWVWVSAISFDLEYLTGEAEPKFPIHTMTSCLKVDEWVKIFGLGSTNMSSTTSALMSNETRPSESISEIPLFSPEPSTGLEWQGGEV